MAWPFSCAPIGVSLTRVDDREVRLLQAAEAVLDPDDARSLRSPRHGRGAPDLPRKQR